MADSTSTPAPELKTYYGNCHCGAFKFNIRIPELTSATECNCSICFKKAYKWVFPGPDCFIIEKGDGTLKEYEFGKKTMAHKFCGICGTGVQGKRHNAPAGMDIGINVRTLRDVDVEALKVNKYAGVAIEPAYVPPTFTGTEPKAELENAKLYTGGCHCGAHAMAMKTSGPVTAGYECDCSVCTRSGVIFTFPTKSALEITNPETLITYQFAKKTLNHQFCSTCGVKVCASKVGELKDEDMLLVNLRCFEGVDWDDLKITKSSYKDAEPLYVVD